MSKMPMNYRLQHRGYYPATDSSNRVSFGAFEEQHGDRMKPHAFYAPVKLVALLVILLMAAALVYAAYISVAHWTGIGV